MTDEVSFNLGSHAAKLESLDTRVIELQKSQERQTEMLQQLLMRNERVKGGLAFVVGASSFFGAIAALAIEWFKK